MSIFEDQWDFMQLGSQDAIIFSQKGPQAHAEQLALYESLIEEESAEMAEAFASKFKTNPGGIPDLELMTDLEFTQAIGRVDDIKEAFDVIVVAAGYLVTRLGVEGAQKAWNLGHETNLAKVRGGAIKRDDGKILQTKEYKEELKAQLYKDLKALVDSVEMV